MLLLLTQQATTREIHSIRGLRVGGRLQVHVRLLAEWRGPYVTATETPSQGAAKLMEMPAGVDIQDSATATDGGTGAGLQRRGGVGSRVPILGRGLLSRDGDHLLVGRKQNLK